MPPEFVLQYDPANQEQRHLNQNGTICDYWCLGVLLFELITNEAPLEHHNEVLFIKMKIRRLKAFIVSNYSKNLWSLIKKMFEVKPHRRLYGVKLVDHPWFADGCDNDQEIKKEIADIKSIHQSDEQANNKRQRTN